MVVESNGIPNHDFLSTMGCCAPEMDYTSTFPLNPVNDRQEGTIQQTAQLQQGVGNVFQLEEQSPCQ